jgi:porphobilinogen deaminase
VQDKLALLQVLERREPDDAVVAETAEKDLEQLLDQKRQARVQGWIDARRTALLDAGELSVNLEALR